MEAYGQGIKAQRIAGYKASAGVNKTSQRKNRKTLEVKPVLNNEEKAKPSPVGVALIGGR